MSIKPGSSVASGRRRRVSGSRSDFSGWRDLRNLVAFNHDGLISTQLSRAHVEHAPRANHLLFGAGACALAVIAVPASAARTTAMTTPHPLISRRAPTRNNEFFKPFIQAPRCELAYGTRRVIAKQAAESLAAQILDAALFSNF